MLESVIFVAALTLAAPAAARELTPREIYKEYSQGVVLVFASEGAAKGSAGTGSIVGPGGEIITNAHVVAKGGRPYSRVFVYLKPDKLRGSMKHDLKRRYEAEVLGLDPALDLAFLKMKKPPAGLVMVPLGDPDAVEIGEPVVAIGHPETGGLWTLTTGSISSVLADFQGVRGKDVFQTEASVNRGNSGGPLLNAYGHMVGINTSISRRASDGLAITDINFSLKSSVAKNWLKKNRLKTLAYAPRAAQAPEARPARPTREARPVPKAKWAAFEPEETPASAATKAKPLKKVEPAVTHARPQKAPATAKVMPKPLAEPEKPVTKPRPYNLDAFVVARLKEMKSLESMMDEMGRKVRRSKQGKRKKRPASDVWDELDRPRP